MDELDPKVAVVFDDEGDLAEDHFIRLALERGLGSVRVEGWNVDVRDLDKVELPGEVLVSTRVYGEHARLIEIPGALALLTLRTYASYFSAKIAAPLGDAAPADGLFTELREVLPSAPEEGKVPVLFWYRDARDGPDTSRRNIACAEWDDISANYAASTRAALSALMDGFRPGPGGKLILWHGEPGTGKTSAIRALARSWTSWSKIEFVTDPEAFFGLSSYMMNVLLGDEDNSGDGWRLLILEDTGELLAADAKANEGQRLSRFLNVADGLIGQGLRVMVLVTTNEPVAALHPAVSRPGRCAAIVNFERLSENESVAWLEARREAHCVVTGSATLAELYAMAEGRDPPSESVMRHVGFMPAR